MANPKGERVATIKVSQFVMPTEFKSLFDIGYQAARYVDTSVKLVEALQKAEIGWPDKVSDDNMALIKNGIKLRKQEIAKPAWYRHEGKNLIACVTTPSEADIKTGNFLRMDPAYADSFSPHQLGIEKEANPALYTLLVQQRKETSKYVSNVLKRLQGMTRAMLEPVSATRGATKSIADKVKELFDSLVKSNKTARDNRGDPTAYDDDLLKRKIAAFHATK